MWSYSYMELRNKTTLRKVHLQISWQCTNRNLASIFSHFLRSEPNACACKHQKKHSIILTVYSLLKLDSESINVAILFSWPVLAHRLTKSIPLKFKRCLKVCSASRKSSARALNVCNSHVWYQTIIYLMKLWKITHFQQNILIWSYIKRPNCQGVLHKFNSQACTQENHYKEHCFLVYE